MPPTAAPTAIVPRMTSRTGSSSDVEEEQGGEIAERENRADAEIDAAGDQAERHAKGDEAELGVEPHQRKQNSRIPA